ncbi:MAG: hypothetical protein ACK5PB_16630 [Pirellula sp.]|jgi:hypothetical protein
MKLSDGTRVGMLATFCLSALSGCSMCCQPYIDDYAAYGSRTPRTDMAYGRVGSPFSDPAYAMDSSSSVQDVEIIDEHVSTVGYDETDDDGVVVSASYEIE